MFTFDQFEEMGKDPEFFNKEGKEILKHLEKINNIIKGIMSCLTDLQLQLLVAGENIDLKKLVSKRFKEHELKVKPVEGTVTLFSMLEKLDKRLERFQCHSKTLYLDQECRICVSNVRANVAVLMCIITDAPIEKLVMSPIILYC